jgi:hypothetical protein
MLNMQSLPLAVYLLLLASALLAAGLRHHLRAREGIASHLRISSSRHLRPLPDREFLDVVPTTPADSLNRGDRIWRKSEPESWEPIRSRTLREALS